MFEKMRASGDVYEGVYEGWYCTNDETFWPEAKLIDGRCPNPECRREVQWLSEKNWFFKLSAYTDRLIFAPQHLYEKVRDPEGLLSTIPAIATAIFGLLAGIWLRTSRSTREKAIGLTACGLTFVLSGVLWNPFFPINKKLWTSSFVLFAGGLSLLLLALAIYLTDIRRIGRQDVTRADAPEHPTLYKPLLVFGTNSIAAYMVSELLDPILRFIPTSDGDIGKTYALWLHRVLPIHGIPELLFGLTIVLITWLVVLPLYRKRIFLRI